MDDKPYGRGPSMNAIPYLRAWNNLTPSERAAQIRSRIVWIAVRHSHTRDNDAATQQEEPVSGQHERDD